MISFHRASYKLLAVYILTTIAILAQPHPSIHQQQSDYYRQNYTAPEIINPQVPFLPKTKRTTQPTHTIFGYHPYWKGTAWQDYNYNLLTTVAWFSAEVTATGTLSNLHGWPVTDLINLAHSHGVDVVLCATLFDSDWIVTLLSNATNRQRLINNLITQVQAGNADGVNIDFESFPASQKNNMVQFITDLTQAFHTQIPGSKVTLAMPSVDWSSAWDYDALASASDGLFIMGYGYHWSGSSTTGALAPLTGYSYNITRTVNDYLTKTNGQANKIILGLPYYGREWAAVSDQPGAATTANGIAREYAAMEALAQTHGRNWHSTSQTPWFSYQNSGWYQDWYDDSLSLALKYDFAIQNNLQGVGMWALGYDGSSPKLWEALADKFGSTTAPLEPQNLTISNIGNGDIMIDFSGATTASEFTVLRQFLGTSTVETIGSFTQRPIIISGLDTTETWFLQLFAANDYRDSPITELSGVKPSHTSQKALVVNGFDRTTGTNNSKDYIRQHGSALWEQGQAFDGTTNEAVIAGIVDLNDYQLVDWILGEEGAANSTFTAEEQAYVREYLENGGHLIISGSEIGYDLVAQGSTADQLFYQNYLKAEYISDAAGGHQGTYGVFGVSGSIFDGITTIDFDNGTHGTYDVDYPDGIKPINGAEICAKFSNVDYTTKGGAGICYNGPFNGSSAYGALIYLSIGFETIYPTAKRDELMTSIINYFDQADAGNIDITPIIPVEIAITAIYPNPFNSRVNIAIKLPETNSVTSSLIITDLLGRIVTELNISAITGSGTISWDGRTNAGKIAPTGMYLAILKSENKQFSRKFTLLK